MMVTGDHPVTARAIARSVNIMPGKTVDELAAERGCSRESILNNAAEKEKVGWLCSAFVVAVAVVVVLLLLMLLLIMIIIIIITDRVRGDPRSRAAHSDGRRMALHPQPQVRVLVSHVTRHTSHVTRHTSHVTRHTLYHSRVRLTHSRYIVFARTLPQQKQDIVAKMQSEIGGNQLANPPPPPPSCSRVTSNQCNCVTYCASSMQMCHTLGFRLQ